MQSHNPVLLEPSCLILSKAKLLLHWEISLACLCLNSLCNRDNSCSNSAVDRQTEQKSKLSSDPLAKGNWIGFTMQRSLTKAFGFISLAGGGYLHPNTFLYCFDIGGLCRISGPSSHQHPAGTAACTFFDPGSFEHKQNIQMVWRWKQ